MRWPFLLLALLLACQDQTPSPPKGDGGATDVAFDRAGEDGPPDDLAPAEDAGPADLAPAEDAGPADLAPAEDAGRGDRAGDASLTDLASQADLVASDGSPADRAEDALPPEGDGQDAPLDLAGADAQPPPDIPWPLTVVDHMPPPEALGVPVDGPITITFSAPLDPATAEGALLVQEEGGVLVGGQVLVEGNRLTLRPHPELNYLTVYSVTVTAGLRDIHGQGLEAPWGFRFTTGERYLRVLGLRPDDGEGEVEVSALIEVTFNKDIDTTTVTPDTMVLRRVRDGLVIAGELSFPDARTVVMMPLASFPYDPVAQDTVWWGVKPNYEYEILLAGEGEGIRSRDDAIMEASLRFTFRTKDLDYGFHWFGPDNMTEKFVPGRPNRSYDPSRPTVIYIHGWQAGGTADDYDRANFHWYFDHGDYNGNPYPPLLEDVSEPWLAGGWNIGIFHWDQFADDEGLIEIDGLLNTEAKIWAVDNGYAGMRYRTYDGDRATYSTRHTPPGRTIADLCYEAYTEALWGNTSPEIRIVGHSLGTQLTARLVKMLLDAYDAGEIGRELMPRRVALLEFASTNGDKSYLDQGDTGGKVNQYIQELMDFYDDPAHGLPELAVEQYLTSGVLSLWGGDLSASQELARRTCFVEYEYRFINKTTDQMYRHASAWRIYLWGYGYEPNPLANGDGGPGATARTSGERIRELMNGYREPLDQRRLFQAEGRETADPVDDVFERVEFDF